ncbi:MAG: hypothetical protein SGILL_001746 [Bacillariaceae sp.]
MPLNRLGSIPKALMSQKTSPRRIKALASATASKSRFSKKKEVPISADGEEVWIFRDDDPQGIDERVLEKNPLKGKWGYGPAVKKKKRGATVKILQKNIDAQDMWFFHPNAKESDIPDNCTVMGEWVQPVTNKNGKSDRKGKKGWGLFGGKGGERRKIIPGGKKKKQKSSESSEEETMEEETIEEITPKTPPAANKEPKKSSLKGASSHSVSSKSKTKSSTKKKSKEGKAMPEGKPPITPTSTKKKKKSQKSKPSSLASLHSSMGSTDFESSMSSIRSPPRNQSTKSITPNSPGSMNSSMASLNSSKQSLGSDDFQLVIRRQPTLETFTLIVQPSYKIAQLKQKINRSRGIPLDAICLSYKEKDLNTVAKKETLKTLGIRNHSTVDIAGFQIYLRTPKGRKYVLNNTDVELSIDKLRETAAEKDKQPLEKIGLYFNRAVMQNGTLLSKYKVKAKSVIEIKYDGAGMESAVQKVYTRRAPGVRKRVGPAAGAPAPPQKKPSVVLKKAIEAEKTLVTIVPAQTGKPSVPVSLDVNDTTEDLLRKALKVVGSVETNFVLTKEGGEQVTVDNYKAENGDTLYVAPVATIQMPDGDIFKHTMLPGQNTVEHLKSLLFDSSEIPVDTQQLVAEGIEMGDSTPITKDAVLNLQVIKPPKVIFIRDTDDEVHTIELQHDETAEDLWTKTAEIVGIDFEELCLAFDETDEEVDFEDYIPSDEDLLAVMVPPSTITVTLPNGDKFELEVMPTATIGELKSVLEEETGTTERQHRLFALDSDEELDDEVQLSEDMDLRLELQNNAENDQPKDKPEEPDQQTSITVTTQDGKDMVVTLDPDSSAMDARKLIADAIGVPIRDLRLSKDSEEVKKGYTPSNGDILRVMPPRVSIKSPDGAAFDVDIRPNDTMVTVRERIATQAGVPASDMVLMKGDKEIGSDYVPSDGDELRLKPRRITVSTPDGTLFQLTIAPNDTSETIRTKISAEAGVPLKDLILMIDDEKIADTHMPSSGDFLKIKAASAEVALPDGSTLNVPTKSTSNVGAVKNFIEAHKGIKRDRIALLNEDAREMGDDVPVGKESKYTVEIKKNNLTIVGRDESTFTIEVEGEKSVESVRKLLAVRTGIPLEELRLSVDEEELQDSYVPAEGDIITIEPPTVEVLLPDGETLELAASHDTTIADIKDVLVEEAGVPVEKQKIILTGSNDALHDETLITKDMSIKLEVQEVEIKKDPFTVTIQTPDEQTLSIEILPNDSQAEFRRKVARAAGVPIKDMRLSKDDEEVDDDFLPSSGDVLDLMPPTVTVELPDKELLELEALPGTTVGDIKDALEEETDIDKARQCMFLTEGSNDVPLSDDSPIVKDINVKLEESTSIKVEGFNGEVFEILVMPRSDLKTLKAEISAIVGIPAKDVRVSKNDEEIKKCVFSEGEAVKVLPPRVYVQFPEGPRGEFGVLPTHTVADLKKKIAKKTEMPAEAQRIFFFQKDEELDNDVSFARSDFVDGTVLQVRYEKPEVVVVLPDGRKLNVTLELSDTKNDVRYKIARELNVATQDLRLLLDGNDLDKNYKPRKGDTLCVQAQAVKVDMPDGSRISLSVMPTQSIADIKDTIESMTNVPMDSFSVFLGGGETPLEDGSRVSKYDFDNSTVLTVRSPDGSPELNVELPDGRSFQLVIDSEMTLPDMTATIEEQFGLPVGGIRLNGDILKLPENASLLSHLGTSVKSNSVLLVDPPTIDVTLPDGEILQLQVMPSMTIADLQQQLESTHPDLVSESVALVARDGSDPMDTKMSVKNLDLQIGIVLKNLPQEMEIKIKNSNGEDFSVHVMPDDDIDTLREQIAALTNVQPDHQHLTFGGKPVDDGETLQEQGIHKDTSVVLEPMRLNIKQASGEEVLIAVKPDFDFRKVKEVIFATTSIDVEDQHLSFEGDGVGDKTLISDTDICNGDVVDLEVFSVSVICWSGDVIELDGIGTKSTIQDVMKKIQDLKSVPFEKQQIMLGGKSLMSDTNKTLKNLKIQHKDALMLDNPDKVDASVTSTPKSKAKSAFSLLQKASSMLSSPKVLKDEDETPLDEKPDDQSGGKTEDSEVEVASLSDEESSGSGDDGEDEDEPVTFTVITPDVKPVTIELDPEDSPAIVKEKISKKVGVPVDELRLSRNDDDALIDDDFVPSSGDILAVQPPTITVVAADGSQFELSALAGTKVSDVKEYIEEQTGTEASVLRLYLSDGGESELKDDEPIRKDTNLRFEVTEESESSEEESENEEEQEEAPTSISVTASDGQVLTIEIDDGDQSRDVRKKIAKKTGIPIKDLRLAKDGKPVDKKFLPTPGDSLSIRLPDIRITLPDGTKKKMPATGSTTIENVKAFLAEETGIAKEDQELYCYGMNGKELISELPKSSDGIDLKLQSLAKKELTTITIETPDEKSFTIEIKESDTAKDVRKRIAKQAGLTAKGLRLTMNGLEIDAKYKPSPGEVLTVEPPVVVIEFVDGETMELEAMPGTTVEDIKEILEDEMGILKSNQKLISTEPNGREWEDDRAITKDCRFRLIEFEEEDLYDEITVEDSEEDDTIDTEDDELVHVDDGSPIKSPRSKLGALAIRVMDPKSHYSHTFEFKPDNTIEDIHIKIPSHSRVADNLDNQILTFNGKVLDKTKTLAESGIGNGDVLALEKYCINIMHFMIDVVAFEDVTCYDTVGMVKTKLAKQQSLPKDQQLLTIKKNGTILDDNYKTLKACGIEHKDVLILQEDNRSPTSRSRPAVKTEVEDEPSGDLDERLAKIKERAEARKRAKAKGKK